MRLSRAHKRTTMMRKSPFDFESHDDWLTHVRSDFPVQERRYTLAVGRMELLRSFYQLQGLQLPAQFADELERIESLLDSARTIALEDLNDSIFRTITMHLSNRARLTTARDERQALTSPRKQIQELLDHLAQKNRYFALWAAYKRGVSDCSVAEKWDEYLAEQLESKCDEEIDFACAMVELDRLLTLFHADNLPLPRLLFERIWFLHFLRGPERMAQTRAVLGTLMAELRACTSA
jgi:hypothetical protein